MSSLLQSFEFSALKTESNTFSEEHTDGIGVVNGDSKGVFIVPSTVPGRGDITGYLLSASNNEGKVEWVKSEAGNIKLEDLSDIQSGSPNNNQIIQYNASNKTWEYKLPKININSTSGIQVIGNPVLLGNTITLNVDSTVLRNSGTQFINGNLNVSSAICSKCVKVNGQTTGYVGLMSPNITNTYTLVFPSTQGNSDTVLVNDGSGNLTWEEMSGGAGIPGGNNQNIQFNNNGSFGGSDNLLWNGTDIILAGGGKYLNTSDQRLKKDIKVIENPMNVINNINGYEFKWKGTNKLTFGFIAQNIEDTILKTSIEDGADGYKMVDYNQVIPFLLEAIKELHKENKTIKTQLKQLQETLQSN